MKYVDIYDETIPIGVRKRHYQNFMLHKGHSFYLSVNSANKRFGMKPGYIEPKYSRVERKSSECEHEYIIEGYEQNVVCVHCRERCPDCAGFPGLGTICSNCGTYEGLF